MSTAFHPNLLTDYSARTWVTGEALFSSILNKEYRVIQDRITQLNKAVKDTNNRHAGTTAPTTKIAGQIVFDDSAKIWYGDPDGTGADDELLTRLTAYKHSLAMAGTDTFKVRGVLLRDFTENTLASTGVLKAFTIATGDLGTNGQTLRLTAWLQQTILTEDTTIQVRFGSTPTSRINFSFTFIGAGAYYIKAALTRISSTAVDIVGFAVSGGEGESVSAFNAANTDINLAATQTLDLNLSAITGGSVIFQGAVVEFAN